MVSFIFTKKAKTTFLKLPDRVRLRITEKLLSLKPRNDIFSVVGRLKDLEPATYKLRVGSYRILLALTAQKKNMVEFLVLKVGDRKDIYL
jgi:mRNA-degrading endonuclease RelE of RelBE toxin-antitoxin system